MPTFFIVILGLFFSNFAFAQDSYTLDEIVVTPHRGSQEISLKNNYSLEILSASEIKEKNLNTLIDVLDYVCGMDLRYRMNFGIQGDLSLRGSTYEQVAILIDGINIVDPQTGHHNLDIPLTNFDIERIEVIKEGSSALFGQGALAGSVNIITKKSTKKSLNLDTVFGEHALFGQTISFSLPEDNFSSRISLDHKVSKANQPNTDFEYKTASLSLNKFFNQSIADILFGYQKKDFGADSFYSNVFPEEEEHTQTLFVKTGLNSKLETLALKNNLFLRKHRDKFILRRNNPTSVNYHTTYVYGFDSNLNLPWDFGEFLLGLDIDRQEINSTNLGKHSRLHEAGFLGLTSQLGNRLSTDLRFRLDYYEKWSDQESFNFGIGYRLMEDKLRLKGSFARAFRIPSFTELYYSDAANKGNADLGKEESDTFTLGVDSQYKIFASSLELFLRRGYNLIDWTRTSITSAWQATNLGRVDFKGIAFNIKLSPVFEYKNFKLSKVDFSYNYTDADKKASGFFSKYALDILKHQFSWGINNSIFGLDFSWQLSYNQRYYGETYFVGDVYIGKKLLKGNFILEPFISIDNFTNTKYTEVASVPQPARWIKSGFKFNW
jgi:iron complex outermembrane receptor protein